MVRGTKRQVSSTRLESGIGLNPFPLDAIQRRPQSFVGPLVEIPSPIIPGPQPLLIQAADDLQAQLSCRPWFVRRAIGVSHLRFATALRSQPVIPLNTRQRVEINFSLAVNRMMRSLW
jgi:hypothetical protein